MVHSGRENSKCVPPCKNWGIHVGHVGIFQLRKKKPFIMASDLFSFSQPSNRKHP